MLGDAILPYHTDRTEATFFQNKDRINKKNAQKRSITVAVRQLEFQASFTIVPLSMIDQSQISKL